MRGYRSILRGAFVRGWGDGICIPVEVSVGLLLLDLLAWAREAVLMPPFFRVRVRFSVPGWHQWSGGNIWQP